MQAGDRIRHRMRIADHLAFAQAACLHLMTGADARSVERAIDPSSD
jgi:hypothetical protein